MKRSLSLVFVAMFFVQQLFAQSLDEGKQFIYYERFNSAKDVFEKLVTANPKNEEAAYWLGQAYIGLEDVTNAKQTYHAGACSVHLVDLHIPLYHQKWFLVLQLQPLQNHCCLRWHI